MRNPSFIPVVILMLCTGIACKERPPDSPAEAAQLALRSLQRGEPAPVYRALPEGWRRDVQALTTRAVGAVDPATWDALGAGLGLLAKGIGRHPEAALTLPLPLESEEDRVRVLQILVELVGHLEDAGLLDHETARKIDVAALLDDPGDQVLPLLLELSTRTRCTSALAGLHGTLRAAAGLRRDAGAAEIDAGTEDQETVLIRMGDQRHTVVFVQVDDRWVPADLAAAWGPWMESATAALDAWIVRWTENREAGRVRVEGFQAAAAHFAETGDIRALLTTLPPL
jgi:hypothetical protein